MKPASPAHPWHRRQLMLGLGALALASTGRASNANAPLKIAIIEVLPWAVRAADGQLSGIYVELGKRLSQLSGLKLQTVLLPYARAVPMLKAGQVDLMFALDGARLEHSATRLAPIATDEVVILGKPGLRFSTLAELNGRTIGQLRYAEYDPALVASKQILRHDTNSYVQGLQMLLLGRLDALVAVRTAADCAMSSLGLQRGAFGSMLSLAQTPISLYMARQRAGGPETAVLKDACDVLRKEGFFQTLIRQQLQRW